MSSPLTSERLWYRPLDAGGVDDFHRLITDDHIRRYLLDGNLFDGKWARSRAASGSSSCCGWMRRIRPSGVGPGGEGGGPSPVSWPLRMGGWGRRTQGALQGGRKNDDQ